jgi:hypothetical protein
LGRPERLLFYPTFGHHRSFSRNLLPENSRIGVVRLSVALFAAGASMELPGDAAAGPVSAVWGAPKLLPVVPWRRALEVLGPGDPPVPLRVLPFDSVHPDGPEVPDDPVLCASA